MTKPKKERAPTLRQKIENLEAERNELLLKVDGLEHDAKTAETLSEKRAGWIVEFKQEVLALKLAAAEMSGYTKRVLEDDAVREAGPTVKAANKPMRDIVEQNYTVPQPDDLRRTGPDAAGGHGLWREHPWDGAARVSVERDRYGREIEKPRPVAWQDRH